MTSCCTNCKPMLSCASLQVRCVLNCIFLHKDLFPMREKKKKIQRDTFVLKREHCCVDSQIDSTQ